MTVSTAFEGLSLKSDRRRSNLPAGALRPIIPGNARIPRLTAPAGTELADAYSLVTVKRPDTSLPKKKGLRTMVRRPPCGVAPSGFRPLRKILPSIKRVFVPRAFAMLFRTFALNPGRTFKKWNLRPQGSKNSILLATQRVRVPLSLTTLAHRLIVQRGERSLKAPLGVDLVCVLRKFPVCFAVPKGSTCLDALVGGIWRPSR